ncbi:MAG: efflux RND transporter periplasmic adaptor subunit, partial [Patescibacteria group bacterium]|nr:efflux RND transporter periplasmic adaptor subunit [Patescibacteria group bacterium]
MRFVASLLKKIKKFVITRKKTTAVIVLIVLIILFFLRPKPPILPDTLTVKKHDLIQTVSVSGSVDALQKVDLSFLTAGQLVYIGAKKNDTVTAGETVAEIDSRTVEKNLQTALISYSEQRNTYDQTIANNSYINNPGDAANDTLKRILQNNQYDLQKAVNSVELQDLARQQSFLVSPIAGILTREDAVSVGTTALPTTVFEVVDPSSLVFSMDVDEADIGKVQIGQPVAITLDPYPSQIFSLPVDSIDFVS